MAKIVIVLSICFTFILFQTDGLNCRENSCLCCKIGECTRPEQHVFPCHGCKDGYTNPSCYENCPASCFNCSQLFHESDEERICYQCKNGYYNGRYKDIKSYPLQQDCSLACVDNCDICTSYYNCISCKENHYLVYGRDCIQCPHKCSQCLSDAGCVACTDGYVWTGRVCEPCKPNCKRCELTGECSECYSGFNLRDGSCNKCPQGCLSCDGLQGCYKCQAGYILTDSMCCINCSNSSQEKAWGNFIAYSERCEDGWSGKNCDIPCDSNCFSCDKKNPEHCVRCLSEMYGPTCENRCSSSCLNKTCNDEDGICSYACLSGFWGEKCEHDCHENCVGRQCERNQGSCSKGCFYTLKEETSVCSINCTCEAEGDCVRCVQMRGKVSNMTNSEGCVETICEKTADCLNGCLLEFVTSSTGQQAKGTVAATATIVIVIVIFFAVCLTFVLKKRWARELVLTSCLKLLPSRTSTKTKSEEHTSPEEFEEHTENEEPMLPLPKPALYSSLRKFTDDGAAMHCLPKQDDKFTDISLKSEKETEEEVIDLRCQC